MHPSTKPAKQSQAPTSKQQAGAIVSASWSGPLPPPETLHAFDGIIENGAERIMRMAEAEQTHRHSIESANANGDLMDVQRGHYLGASVSIACIAGAVFTAYIGASWAVSVALVGIPVMGAVQAFIGMKK